MGVSRDLASGAKASASTSSAIVPSTAADWEVPNLPVPYIHIYINHHANSISSIYTHGRLFSGTI